MGWGDSHHGWGLALLECFLGHVATRSRELERQQIEGRRWEGERCRCMAATGKRQQAIKDDNLRLHGQSWLPSPPGSDGECVPCGAHSITCLSGHGHSSLWVNIDPVWLVPQGPGLKKHIPASPISMQCVRCWCIRGKEEWLRRKQTSKHSILPF
jgi:hypothetical protein